MKATDWTVTAGDYDFRKKEPFEEEVFVKKLFIHKNFQNMPGGSVSINDIGKDLC